MGVLERLGGGVLVVGLAAVWDSGADVTRESVWSSVGCGCADGQVADSLDTTYTYFDYTRDVCG